MRLITLIIITFCSFSTAHAQFELTPKGFVDRSNPEKDYLVLTIDGKSKADLYKQSLIFLNKLYASPKDVISAVDGEVITINGIEKDAIRRTAMHKFSINYTITLEFKDGKIKATASSFKLTSYAAGHQQIMHLTYSGFSMDGSDFGIFGKKGDLKYEKTKSDLENFFNIYLDNLKSHLNKPSQDW